MICICFCICIHYIYTYTCIYIFIHLYIIITSMHFLSWDLPDCLEATPRPDLNGLLGFLLQLLSWAWLGGPFPNLDPTVRQGNSGDHPPRWRLIGFHPLDAPTSQITSRAVHPKSLLAPFATNDPTPGASDGAPGVWRKKLILSRSPGPPAIPQPHLDAMDLSIKRALTSWSMDDRYPMAQPPGDVSRSPAEARQWSCPGSGHPPNLPRSKGSQNREKYGNILYKWRFYDWKQD